MTGDSFETIPPYVLSPFTYEQREGELAIHAKIEDYLYIPPWKGNIMDCNSDLDCYGYENLDWDVDYCVFYDDDEQVPAIYAGIKKQDLQQKVLDAIEERLLEFIHYVREQNKEEYILSLIYERKD